jgi:hypothetical protein
MPRESYVIRNGELVPKHLAAPLHEPNAAPNVIRDGMEPTMHMATGRIFESKSAFRRETKAAGCVEIGTHQFKPRVPIKMDKRQRVQDIQRAIFQLRNGGR